MESIQTLDPRDPRAREALIGLLGTTLAGLKEIDRSIVGGSNNVTAQKTDLKQFANLLTPTPQSPPPQHIQAPPQYIPPTYQPIPQPVPPAQVIDENPDQLVFDFNKPITPATINDKLDIIIGKLNSILEKLTS